jgi:hypothetical protein
VRIRTRTFYLSKGFAASEVTPSSSLGCLPPVLKVNPFESGAEHIPQNGHFPCDALQLFLTLSQSVKDLDGFSVRLSRKGWTKICPAMRGNRIIPCDP